MKDDLIYRREAIKTMRRLEPSFKGSFLEQAMRNMPGVPEIIQCKDCNHWNELENGTGFCHRSENGYNWFGVDATDFCSFAKRKTDG